MRYSTLPSHSAPSTNFALILRILRILYILRVLQILFILPIQLIQMASANSPDRPQTPPPNTTRDQRLQAQTLHNIGMPCRRICEQLNISLRQVRYAISHRITPQKTSGRPSQLTQEEVDYIIAWVCASKANRRTPLIRIPLLLELNISYYCVRTALRNAGFSRRVARRKPPISERNRTVRLY
jgi:transposase